MHFGTPVVPDENMMNNGWLKGTCSNLIVLGLNGRTKSFKRIDFFIVEIFGLDSVYGTTITFCKEVSEFAI